MKTLRIGINGFGRIGRSLTRVIRKYPNIELVAINDLADVKNLAHLLKYDTVHGHFPDEVKEQAGKLVINGREISVFSEKEPANIPWASVGVDLVIEATGRFKTTDLAIGHIKAGAKKVIISAPATDDTKTIVLGANGDELSSDDIIVSNASCTTNSVAPLLKIVDEVCGVDHAYITTVHSYTTDQQLQDGPHKDFRRGRAAAESIVPTSTGAAKAITRIFPELEGRIGGAGIRVPVPDGSLTDITITVKKNTTVEEINTAFKKASEEGPFKGYLGYTADPIVSRDVIGSPYSVWFDEGLTSVLGNMVKVVGWYDNEMGYSHRLADLIMKMG
ncbi:glyceraldehyde-3-phosphate dehydrogenase, type I [Owenweeksia hongkongensis DSM 17368]|uniref:Glyceraldehyde-3-phosphate dehydrogenase, type I n=1 Tax=Owenweeksia hongkongensis (strain DSM 17368 / CIP 108786 / JCM 12287 / NRRL B-23963 / UST20020801) TaxID=926562 RepID=G8R6J2_OWEHD|nr:type I glyceraldehyde-3-phosphate dehydrogenase [Owenweeksia hongkongensis]AEV34455.1 glyceraldehyde-3-phosphate dehydrogenase, type I [Owenweeksia hongkongensis DSM 17368]